MLFWKNTWGRLGIAFTWFALVQAAQLSWLATPALVGVGIIFVYFLFVVLIGAQFAFLSWMIAKERLTLTRAAALAGLWVLLEWSRLFICTGFTWNPVGLALASLTLPMQAASLFGIYGLSFWVIFTNLAALRAVMLRTRRAVVTWGVLAALPFVYGALQQNLLKEKNPQTFAAVLVQTDLLPGEKEPYYGTKDRFVPPLEQWSRILAFIEEAAIEKPDLIVLPEASVPFSAHRPIYPIVEVSRFWRSQFGEESLSDFPQERIQKYVGNAFLFQALANHYGSEVIAGLDDRDPVTYESFNAAFHFLPQEKKVFRYEKRVLLPIGEYIPFRGWHFFEKLIADTFDIENSFAPGKEAKLFLGKVPMGISICYEETFANLIRETKGLGAELFVNITNDGWYPESRLPEQHFAHGIIRAVENGTPLLRACNTGITAGIDCFGNVIAVYPEVGAGALFVKIPLSTFPTLYTFWGDSGILFLSLICLFFLKPRNGD